MQIQEIQINIDGKKHQKTLCRLDEPRLQNEPDHDAWGELGLMS